MSTFFLKKEKVLKSICLFIICLDPLILLAYGGTIYPYIIPKALAFIFLVDLLIIFYVLLMRLNSNYQPRFKSPLLWTIIIYLVALFLSSAVGQNFRRSFWGTLEYANGLFLFFHLLIFLIILLALFREKRNWLILLEISVFVSFLASLIGLKELIWAKVTSGYWVRIESVFGNPLYFAHFLLFNLFFGAFLLAEYIRGQFVNLSFFSKKFLLSIFNWRSWRFLYYLLVIILELFLIFFTQTRGGVLGVIFGILALIILSLIVYRQKILRFGLLSLILVSIIGGVALLANSDDWQFLQIGPLKRLSNFSLSIESSMFRRLLVWQAGLESFPQHWVFGWGWGNFDYGYLTYFPPQLMEDEGAAMWFGQAHNIIVEHLVTSGLTGTLAYIFLFVAILLSWFKIYHQKTVNHFSLILIIGLLVADFVFNLFAFYSIASYVLFFITLGLLIFYERSSESKLTTSQTNLSKIFVFGSIILVIVSLIFYVKPTFSISRKLHLAVNLEKQAKATAIIAARDLYQQAAEKTGYTQIEAVMFFNRFITKWGHNFHEEEMNYYEKTIQLTEPLVQTEPYNLRLTNELLFLYKATFSSQDKYLSAAQDLAIGAKRLFPSHPLVYYHLGAIFLAQQKPALALGEFQKAIKIDPKISQSYWLALKPAIILGKMELVDEYLSKIETIEHPDPINNPAGYNSSISLRPKRLRELAETFTQVGLYRRAIQILEDLLHLEEIFALPFYKVESQKIETLAQLAPLYAAIGQDDKAKEIAYQMVLLDPRLEEQINQFLKELEAGNFKKIAQ